MIYSSCARPDASDNPTLGKTSELPSTFVLGLPSSGEGQGQARRGPEAKRPAEVRTDAPAARPAFAFTLGTVPARVPSSCPDYRRDLRGAVACRHRGRVSPGSCADCWTGREARPGEGAACRNR